MLVLSRKKNETLIIANEIRVTALEVRGSQVRLGIEAPATVSIRRREVPRQSLTMPDKKPVEECSAVNVGLPSRRLEFSVS